MSCILDETQMILFYRVLFSLSDDLIKHSLNSSNILNSDHTRPNYCVSFFIIVNFSFAVLFILFVSFILFGSLSL
jgi:hypothetical protein